MRSKSYSRPKPIGKAAFAIAVVIIVVNAITIFFAGPSPHLEGELGICLPSPNLWNFNPIASFIINNAAFLGVAVALILYNKEFDIAKDPGQVFPSLFLILSASIPWLLTKFNSSIITAAVNLSCIWILSSAYRKQNATGEFFAVATLISLGSMFQYGFIFMIPIYAVAGLIIKAFRIKEVAAFILGLIAPYWTAVGLGLVSVFDFRIPTLTNLFNGYAPASDLFIVMLNLGFTIVIGLLLMLNTIVRLYAGNSRVLALYNLFNIVGFASALCIIFDFNNLLTYISTFYMMIALQIAYLFSLNPIKRPIILYLIIAAIYLTSFILII